MKKYICTICGYVHDEESLGLFSELDDSYTCPHCGAPKELFIEKEEKEESKKDKPEIETTTISTSELPEDFKKLSNAEINAILLNLARGCEKQYMEKESKLFKNIATAFKPENNNEDFKLSNLIELVEKDLNSNLPIARKEAELTKDRGALRAITWNEKVTFILKTLLDKYNNIGEDLINNTSIYVCTICGFIFIGNDLPTICPICKVPNNKFEKIMEDKHE